MAALLEPPSRQRAGTQGKQSQGNVMGLNCKELQEEGVRAEISWGILLAARFWLGKFISAPGVFGQLWRAGWDCWGVQELDWVTLVALFQGDIP